jgi:hypothetical protein
MRRVLLAVVVLLPLALIDPAHAAVSPGVGISTTNLLMYWDINNPQTYQGTTTLSDLSGNNYNATLVNSTGYARETTGSYISFSGGSGSVSTNPYASVGTINPDFSTGFSIAFYGSFGSTADNWERIIDWGNAAQTANILVARESTYGNIFYESWNASGASSRGTCRGPSSGTGSIATTTPMTYQQYTLTVSASGICQWYLNGSTITTTQTAASNVLPVTTIRTNTWIGRSNWSQDNYLEGRIVRLAIYNKALDQSEVTQTFNSMTDVTWPTFGGGNVNANENQTVGTTVTASESTRYFFVPNAPGDNGKFNLDSYTGALTFKSAPNFEQPDDSGGNGVYDLSIRGIDANGNHNDYIFTITLGNVAEYSTLSLPSLSATPYKGIFLTITVTPSAGSTGGIVSYYVAGKRIPNCYKKTFAGTGNSTCSWKPPVQGFKEITATFTPTGSEYAASTSKKTFWIYKRSTTR